MLLNFPQQTEIEATVVIRADDPNAVADEVANLSEVANYPLLQQESKLINDIYLDTLDNTLRKKKLALRIREIGNSCWITLKGPSQLMSWGGGKRLEIETAWSPPGFLKVVEELQRRDVTLPDWSEAFHNTHPLEVFRNWGFIVIQNRENHRRVRNIVAKLKKDAPVLAEMDIDEVNYFFKEQKVCHHEVEIEAKTENYESYMKTILAYLIEKFGSVLQLWHHNKLVTGKAIEKLLAENAVASLLDQNDHLKPEAYDKIEEYLTRGWI